MNTIFIEGRLADDPKIMGGEKKYGLVRFAHDEGNKADGTKRQASYRTAYCSEKTIEYLKKKGWGKGDQIFVEGSERIEVYEKDGIKYTNINIYSAKIYCGLKKATAATQEQASQESQDIASGFDSPRSISEIESEFDETGILL